MFWLSICYTITSWYSLGLQSKVVPLHPTYVSFLSHQLPSLLHQETGDRAGSCQGQLGRAGSQCKSQRWLWRSFVSTLNQAWILCVLRVHPFVECNRHSLCSLIQPEECRLHSTKKGHKISKTLKLSCPQQTQMLRNLAAITPTLKWGRKVLCILVNLSKIWGLGESEPTTLGFHLPIIQPVGVQFEW